MKITEYSGRDSHRILIGMLLDRTVCARIAANWVPEGLFGSRWENLIASWAVRHLQKFEQPIGRAIEGVFDRWAEKRDGDKEVPLIEKFLFVLGEECERREPLASDYLLDLAGRHFNLVRMRQFKESLEVELDGNDVEAAQERLSQFRRIELGVGSVVVPGRDFDVWVDAFDAEKLEPLLDYPDPLGKWFGGEFTRDAFVAFTGAFGRGKSWWLLDLAYRAIKKRRRVALFEVGDMSRRQVLRRMGQRASRRPKWTGEVGIPKKYESLDAGPIIEKRRMEGLNARDAWRAWKKVDPRERLRLSVHPSSSVSAEQMASIVSEWQREEWVPDLIVLDYVDLLAPPRGIQDRREQIDETWKQLRRLSQELHCCVVTATQADAASYNRDLIGAGNFSECRSKNDHVTANIGLNVTDDDRKQGTIRLNWLKRRDEAYSEQNKISVAGCLAIGCPAIVSCER